MSNIYLFLEQFSSLQNGVYGLFASTSERVFLLQGSKAQLQADAREITNTNLNEFELPSKPKNPVQEVDELRDMTPEKRRELELNFFDTFVGICNEKNVKPCIHEDVKFYAGLLAKGDPECILTCSKDQMIKNKDRLPNKDKTIEFVTAIGVFWKELDMNSEADKQKLTEMNRKGCAAVGSECPEKRLISIFAAAVIYVIAQVGLLAAQTHISAMSDQESTA